MCMIYVLKGLDTSEENLLFKKSEGITENFLIDLCVGFIPTCCSTKHYISLAHRLPDQCVFCAVSQEERNLFFQTISLWVRAQAQQ